MSEGIDNTMASLILDGISDLRQNGCREGTKNSTNIGHLQSDTKQHDQRIVAVEKDVSSITTKIEDMPEQVSTQVIEKMNGQLKKNHRTMIPITVPAIGLKVGVPASWLGWIGAIALISYGVYVIHVGRVEARETARETLNHLRNNIGMATNGSEVANL